MGSVITSIAIIVILIVLWIMQFVQLMLLSPEDFPGPYDKPMWFLGFVLLSPLAPIAFFFWKTAYREMRKRERQLAKRANQ